MDEAEDNEELTDAEQQFVDEYLVDRKMGPAALRCGYAYSRARQTGRDIYNRPHVKKAIKEAIEEQSIRCHIEADKVIREMSYIAFSDIREIRLNDDGTISCTTGTGRAIQSIKIDRTTRTLEDGTVEINIKGEVKLYDKRQALTTLMQHLGLLITELPGLEVLLNRLPNNVGAILRKLIANPALMPAPALPDVQTKPETINVENTSNAE